MSRSKTAGRGPRRAQRSPARDRRSSTPRPRRSASAPRGPRRTPLTGRAAILALALAFVLVAVALPFKIWLGQRSDLASLHAQIARAQDQVAMLTEEDQRWRDPAYIEAQARMRLHYVLPGQPSNIVLGVRPARSAAALRDAINHPAAPPASGGPWYDQLWQSMQTAGGPPADRGPS
jgi:hypothetical protein